MSDNCLAIMCVSITDRPTPKQLVFELDEVVHWEGFGLALGVPNPKIASIKKSDSQGGVASWKISLFAFWLDYDVDASWKKVIDALRVTKNNVLADKLERKYLKSQGMSLNCQVLA